MNIVTGEWWKYATPTGTPIINTTYVIMKAQVAGKKNYLCSFQIFNNHATVSTLVTIKDGLSTVIWTGYLPAVTGAVNVCLPVPIECTVGNAITVACVTTGASVFISAQGYTAI